MKHFLRAHALPTSSAHPLKTLLRRSTFHNRVASQDALVGAITDALGIHTPPAVRFDGDVTVDEFLFDTDVHGPDGTVGRPWVTIAADAATGEALAVRVGFDPASYADVAAMLEPSACAADSKITRSPARADARLFPEVA